jgi:hypothetical protein
LQSGSIFSRRRQARGGKFRSGDSDRARLVHCASGSMHPTRKFATALKINDLMHGSPPDWFQVLRVTSKWIAPRRFAAQRIKICASKTFRHTRVKCVAHRVSAGRNAFGG